ncbi:MAG: hypothetical protein BWX64_02394 [Acidobacteria bacterium ADurb.Bin051]|nr:MAG: hypothetical protein BWX64_02394 [Acidobacteria bacterium ADurb.Bin051]
MGEGGEGVVERPGEARGGVVGEDEAGAGAGLPRVRLDGVGEPAGAAHHGGRAVAQAVELVEAARLVAGRHEEDVRSRLDPVRERLVVAPVEPDPAGEGRLEGVEERLVARLARAEDDEAEVVAPELRGQALEAEIDPLLLHETAHHADHGNLVSGLHPHPLEQRPLHPRLAGEIGGAVMVGEVRIVPRIPVAVVDAVDDPDQARGPLAEEAVEPEAALGGEDLAGVGLAHGGEQIGVPDPVLQEAQLVGGEILGRQQPAVRLESELADRVPAGRREEPVPGEEGAGVERGEGGVPVVDVEDVGRPAHPLTAGEGGHGEEGEAVMLVPARGVDPVLVEEGRAVQEVDSDVARRQRRGVGREAQLARAEPDRDVAQEVDGDEVVPLAPDRRIERQEEADVLLRGAEHPREPGDRIAEPPGLGEGGGLGRHLTDRERPHPRPQITVPGGMTAPFGITMTPPWIE